MERREFLAGAAAAMTATAARAAGVEDIPIIDTHFHLFDNRRPQGAPYTGSKDYKGGVALPADYRREFAHLGVVGAIELEASPWIEDNLWVLEQLQTDPLFVGTVGDLEPEKPEFPEYLDRYRKNPLFLGIRCGNIWGRNVASQVNDPRFIDGLKRVAAADMVMDTANPNVALLEAMIRINDKVPDLRIVLDHLPSFDPKPGETAAYDAALKAIHGRPRIFAKLSEIQHRAEPAHGLAAHKPRLDMFMDVFGEDRVVFGSDWPESVGAATPAEIVTIARAYFATRTRAEAEKFFWKNSLAVYKWKKRAGNQPAL
ncbi:MAG TPA: amidohydrolase family protein [Rhizomicrobium sp.]|jgi:predicted TIM-barrel fold metal-dependent hydrolase|nr:amidohydrolase family protein [Rhizomicrobium sp.]